MGLATLSGPGASGGKDEGSRKETPQGTWLGGAQRGSLWLFYAGPLAEKQKVGSQVSSIDQS